MTTSLLPIALAITELVPSLAKLLNDTKDKNVVEKIVTVARGLTHCKEQQDIIGKLKEDPALALKLEDILLTYDRDLELGFLGDRQNARLRDLSFLNTGRSNTRADVMVIAAALRLISCLASLAFYQHQLPGEAVGIISTIAGIFGACLKDAYAFEFGSSRGSKNKDEHVAALLKKME